jgi:N-acetylneuraminic acid mutarotase
MLLSSATARAQGTAFTYQGRLNTVAGPVNGIYDLRFALWDAESGGSMLGNVFTNLAVAMIAGTFTATLDFGDSFDGCARWMEISVRTNGNGVFTPLSPRQQLTPAPYAIHAGSVNALGIHGTISVTNIGPGTITSNALAPGAAAGNLAANGQSALPSSAIVFSADGNDTNLLSAGFVPSGGFVQMQSLWRQQSPSPLAGRVGHTAIWTGNKMLVWGGNCGNDNPDNPPPKTWFSDGAFYDPVTKSWSAISTNGALVGREEFSTVWTGANMIIWGGFLYNGVYNYFNDGASYNVTSNTWTALSTNGAPLARYYHSAVWSGSEMIIWGGMFSDSSGFQTHPLNDGYRYNPISNTWSLINANGAPTPRAQQVAVWTGSEMLIWGGLGGPGMTVWYSDGARYNPALDKWSPITSTNAPGPRSRHTAVWTGSEMIAWGGWSGGPPDITGGRYNPQSDKWSATDILFAPSYRQDHTAVWTGREMIVWGGRYNGVINDGGSYDPSSDTWLPVTNAPRAPLGRVNHTAVWAGTEMIIFGGEFPGQNCYGDTWSCSSPRILFGYERH